MYTMSSPVNTPSSKTSLGRNRLPSLLSVLFSAAFSLSAVQSAHSQSLQEIVVTAQKRAESLQDVSVSVTALSGEQLADGAIGRLEEVTAFIPNFTLSETGIGTTIYIRGVGSGINQGFEQSVGMYFDGIYYARAQLARSPIFDLERVEVLRGPQVTLFGNNSIGGAVSINTARPTDTFEGSIGFLYEPEHGEEELTAIFSGPLSDNFAARLAIRKYDMDGYIKNVTTQTDGPTRDYLTTRLILDFIPDSDAFDVSLKLERSEFDVEGRQIAIIRDEPTNGAGTSSFSFIRQPDLTMPGDAIGFVPGQGIITADWIGNLTGIYANATQTSLIGAGADISGAGIFNSIGGRQVAFPGELTRRGANKDASINTVDNATLNLNIPLDIGDLKFTTGQLNYEYEESCDCDFTGAELIQYESSEGYEQFSQEIRFTSNPGNVFEYIVGAYYQKDSLSFQDFVIVVEDTALEETLGFIFRTNPAANISNLVGVSVPRDFSVESELFAGFAQGTFHITPATRLMLGIRESKTLKEGRRELSYRQDDLTTPVVGSQFDEVRFAFNAALSINPHSSFSDRKEKRTSWAVILEQDLSEDYMMYLSAVRGYKGGGFDARSNNPTGFDDLTDENGDRTGLAQILFSPGTFEFEDEEALAFELGLKARVSDSVEINIAYFNTEIKNLQLSVFDGGVGFNVSNAGKAVTQGIEIDWRVALSENWYVNGALAWLDFEYKDYKDGLCTAGDLLALRDQEVAGITDLTPENCADTIIFAEGDTTTPLRRPQADLTGETNQYVADYSGSLSLQYERPVWSGYLFKGSVDVNFTDNYNPTQNLDPELEQGGYEVYNMRLSLGEINGEWELALLGRNITDREIVTYANDVPLSTSLFGTKTSYGFVQRTASWALQGKYNF